LYTGAVGRPDVDIAAGPDVDIVGHFKLFPVVSKNVVE